MSINKLSTYRGVSFPPLQYYYGVYLPTTSNISLLMVEILTH
jgi:hypothetical protein